jgi:hypothetical protein
MDAKLPAPANCLTIQSATNLYVYRNTNIRDTYTLMGDKWLRTATATNVTIPTNAVCQPGTLSSTPTSTTITTILLVIILFLLVLFKLTEWFHLRGQR